jgi:hypothetical protein
MTYDVGNETVQNLGVTPGRGLLLQVRAAVFNGEFDALVRPGSVSHAANQDQYDLPPLTA